MPVDISLELNLARNMFGRLKPTIRRRLQSVIDNPCSDTWDKAHGIIVGSDGWMTLWQAVITIGPDLYQHRQDHGPARNSVA